MFYDMKSYLSQYFQDIDFSVFTMEVNSHF